LHSWKHGLLYIAGIGVSNLGNWIYLVAINLLVLNMTGSPAAVAGLFIIRPLATLLTNSWAGSIIDRANKRTLMIMTDVIISVAYRPDPVYDVGVGDLCDHVFDQRSGGILRTAVDYVCHEAGAGGTAQDL